MFPFSYRYLPTSSQCFPGNYRSSIYKATTIALFGAEIRHFPSKMVFLVKTFWLCQLDLYDLCVGRKRQLKQEKTKGMTRSYKKSWKGFDFFILICNLLLKLKNFGWHWSLKIWLKNPTFLPFVWKAKGNNSESHGANLMAIERLPQRQKPNPL